VPVAISLLGWRGILAVLPVGSAEKYHELCQHRRKSGGFRPFSEMWRMRMGYFSTLTCGRVNPNIMVCAMALYVAALLLCPPSQLACLHYATFFPHHYDTYRIRVSNVPGGHKKAAFRGFFVFYSGVTAYRCAEVVQVTSIPLFVRVQFATKHFYLIKKRVRPISRVFCVRLRANVWILPQEKRISSVSPVMEKLPVIVKRFTPCIQAFPV
jgi:hypothetical protein